MSHNQSILFMCAGFGGGIGKMIRFVSSLCVSHFDEVVLLHRGRESPKDVPPDGVKEVVIPHSMNGPMLLWRFKQIMNIRRKVSELQPDIVCCFGSEMSVMLSLAMIGRRRTTKVILAERGDPYTLSSLWQKLSRWAFNRADKCVFQLERQGQWYGEKVMQKSSIIPNAFIPTGNVQLYEGERKKTIVSVGRFVYEKRYEVLIEAFSKVHAVYPDYRLIIYGEGPYRSKYEALIERLGLGGHVDMPGYVTDSMSVIRDARVFVLSSLYEGMPNTLIEALAVGVPTVSTDCTPGGPYFLTKSGANGLLVPVNDANAMADAIIRIIGSPELTAKLSEEGRIILDSLKPELVKHLWLQFFNDLSRDDKSSSN